MPYAKGKGGTENTVQSPSWKKSDHWIPEARRYGGGRRKARERGKVSLGQESASGTKSGPVGRTGQFDAGTED